MAVVERSLLPRFPAGRGSVLVAEPQEASSNQAPKSADGLKLVQKTMVRRSFFTRIRGGMPAASDKAFCV